LSDILLATAPEQAVSSTLELPARSVTSTNS
jgi:hypothetical protein